MDEQQARNLAEAVANDGFTAHHGALMMLFADARRQGVPPLLLEIAADPDAPEVVRQRALGRVLTEHRRREETGRTVCLPAAAPVSPGAGELVLSGAHGSRSGRGHGL